jgi:hypothetical protein
VDNIAWLVPALVDRQGPQGSIIGVATALSRYPVTSRTIRVGHGTGRR